MISVAWHLHVQIPPKNCAFYLLLLQMEWNEKNPRGGRRGQHLIDFSLVILEVGRRDHCCTASLSPARLEAYEPSKGSCSKSNNGSLTLSQLTQGKLGVPGKSKLSWEKTASCLAPGCPKQETRELESCILKTHLYLGWCGCRLECTLCLGPSHSSHSASSADVAGHRLA